MKSLPDFTMGCGDRFGLQGRAQLSAFIQAQTDGIDVSPVWNKSFREHSIIGTAPSDVRTEADDSVQSLGWTGDYFVDADHIGLGNVDGFLEASDFFTLDVAEAIGTEVPEADIKDFVRRHASLCAGIDLPGCGTTIQVTETDAERIGRTFLAAIREAGRIYRHVLDRKGEDVVVEVSMDESDAPQTPLELLFILAEIAHEGIPAQTIAPKFTGRFNKGVDYVGDVAVFESEFDADAAVLQLAVKEYELPANLKLSVHSGSDKFGIYPSMRRVLEKRRVGLHIKTAGTTWLEEVAGLIAHGGRGMDLARRIYSEAFLRSEELCGPYAAVIDIDLTNLPEPDVVNKWEQEAFLSAIRHNQSDPAYSPDIRQLLHVGYKVAAEMGREYLDAVTEAEAAVSELVAGNLLENHIRPIFG